MIVPINCNVASAVVLEQNANPPKMLLLRRATEVLRDQWCHVAGGIEAGETAWQAAMREVREETGLNVLRLFSADYTEQFYEAARNVVTIVPAFVAYVDSTQTVHLNAEHSAYRWVSFSEADALVAFGGQRRLYEEVRREFVDRAPSPLHEITLGDDSGA